MQNVPRVNAALLSVLIASTLSISIGRTHITADHMVVMLLTNSQFCSLVVSLILNHARSQDSIRINQ